MINHRLKSTNKKQERFWQMNEATIVIFGITGDLAKRKLLPALYRLIAQKHIKKCIIIGTAFEDIAIDEALSRAKPFIKDLDPKIWDEMSSSCYYQQLNFQKPEDYVALHARIMKLEKQHKLSGNRLIYFAAAAHFFCDLTKNVSLSGIAQRTADKDRPWHRVVYEKPFGHDLASAHQINTCISENLNESQIYRIDHYLTKELVSNIALVRFTNCIFEPLWNNRFIDQVQIILSEEIGIEGRGPYYDVYGALCDVVQNHMLELMALVGMESPEMLTGDYIRSARARVLERVRVVDGILGQYEGYTREPGVKPNSNTDTFAALYLTIDNHRWTGVPFYLRTGKHLQKKETVIHIKFKQVDCLLTHNCPSDSNWLTIQISPDATFALSVNIKKPETNNELVQVGMEFCHSCIFGSLTPEAYEVVLQEVMRGEQSIAVRFDEIESAWRLIDTVKKMNLPVYEYEKGSEGPKELEDFSKKHGVRWRS